MGKFNAYFSDKGGPNMAGSDATENFSNFTPLGWPNEAPAQQKIMLISIVLYGGSADNLE